MFSATQTGLSVVKRIQRHSGGVIKMLWDPASQWLFSSSVDGLICCWDFGGATGDVFDLRAHQCSVNALLLIGNSTNRKLLSCGDDGALLIWKMDDDTLKKRKQVSKWLESDNCQLCGIPFFWNLREVWQRGTNWIKTRQTDESNGLPIARQHHCRKCGKAVCGKCSSSTSTLPFHGFELPVRVCSDCAKSITSEELTPLCTPKPFSLGHSVIYMDIKYPNEVLSVGRDRAVKLWDISSLQTSNR